MKTSVESFTVGLAAFAVLYMFFFSPAMLLQGSVFEIAHVAVTAVAGVYFLSCAVQGWFFGHAGTAGRIALVAAALATIAGGWLTDGIGLIIVVGAVAAQKMWYQADS